MGFLGIGNDRDPNDPYGIYLFGVPLYENAAARAVTREQNTEKKEVRLDAKTDRVETRQEGHTDRVDSRSGRVEARTDGKTARTALRNADGSGPLEDAIGGVQGFLGGVLGQAGAGVVGQVLPYVAVGAVVLVVGAAVLRKK